MTFDASWLNSATRPEKERLLRSLLELKESKDLSKLSRWKAWPGFQEKFLKSQAAGRICLTPNQEGKSQANSSKVLTNSGFQRIDSLKIGDGVFDELGQLTQVTGVFPQGKIPMVRISFDDDVEIDVSENHLWKIIPRKWEAGPKRVVTSKWIYDRYKNLSGQAYNRVQIPVVPGIEFSRRSVSIDPYILGILLGNGGMTHGTILFSTIDPEHITLLRTITKVTHADRCNYRLAKSKLNDEIKQYGLSGKHSYEKFVPKDYLYNTDDIRLGVLQGLMDTDGHQGRWLAEYSTTSPQLAEDILFLLRSFGQKASVREVRNAYSYKGEKKIGRPAFRIQIKSQTIQLFRLKRKQPTNISTRTPHRIIRDIQPIEESEATCISVASPRRTYVAEHFIVTHNTELSAHEAACYALNCHPYKNIRTPNMGWIITSKPLKEGVEKDILPKLRGLVGSRDIVDIRPNNQGIPYKIIWRTGSVSYMMSAEQDDGVFEGTTMDWVWFDEPMRREIWIAVLRGLQKSGGHWWWSMTPLDEPWVYDEIYLPSIEGKDKDIEVFEAEPGENKSIPIGNREKFWSKLNEDELKSRKFGKFAHLAGRVFKHYVPAIHRIPAFDIPKHWPVWAGTDPHRNKPHAILFLAVAPTGVYYVCNEIFIRCVLSELGGLAKEIADQYTLIGSVIDTSSEEEEHGSKVTARQLLKDAGWPCTLAQKKNKKNSGIHYINQLFSENRLFIMDHCVRTHRELMLQTYKKNRADQAQVLEEPMKKFDDMTDALRYVLVENPDFSGPARIWEREVPYGRDIPKPEMRSDPRSPFAIEHGGME